VHLKSACAFPRQDVPNGRNLSKPNTERQIGKAPLIGLRGILGFPRGSTAQIRPALAARSVAIVKSPIGPAPMTTTVLPERIDARRRECRATARGSDRVASPNYIPAGMGRKLAIGKLTS